MRSPGVATLKIPSAPYNMPPPVQVKTLGKRFASTFSKQVIQAVDDVNLHVEPGEIFGLLGPNGAGKSTLVKILLGIVRPTTGTALLFGRPAHRPEARHDVGYLPENHQFPGFLTATQMLDVYGQFAGVPADQRKRRIPVLLERVRLDTWGDTRIRKFSKGMMQRLGLAQALLNDPSLLFLDEPTDGVDPLGRREIRDLLIWLQEQGTTVFINSHLLSEVEQVCTRVAILNQGCLVREGTIDALTANAPIYEVTSTPIPPQILSMFSDVIVPLNGEPLPAEALLLSYQIHVSDRRVLNEVLDALRGGNVMLESVHPLRRSLEDYFIEVVEEANRETS